MNYDDVPRFIQEVWEWVDNRFGYGIHGDVKASSIVPESAYATVGQTKAVYEMQFGANGDRWGLIAEMDTGEIRVEAYDGVWLDESSFVFRRFYSGHFPVGEGMRDVARWVVQGLE